MIEFKMKSHFLGGNLILFLVATLWRQRRNQGWVYQIKETKTNIWMHMKSCKDLSFEFSRLHMKIIAKIGL